jgi:hypothetical protein
MDTSDETSRNSVNNGYNPNLLLILKFLSSAALFASVFYLTVIGRVDEQTFLVIVTSLLSAIGVHTLVKKN